MNSELQEILEGYERTADRIVTSINSNHARRKELEKTVETLEMQVMELMVAVKHLGVEVIFGDSKDEKH